MLAVYLYLVECKYLPTLVYISMIKVSHISHLLDILSMENSLNLRCLKCKMLAHTSCGPL